jgi:hypothetical protein
VIARPLSLEGALTGQSEDGETWLISPAARLDRDGGWTTRIRKPPLPEGSFDFAAVIAPTPARTPAVQSGQRPSFATSMNVRPTSIRRCSDRPTIRESGVASCLVLDATEVARYAP